MKKSILILPIIFLSAILILPGQHEASAAVSYPVPHRSWIKLGLVAYQPATSMTAEQLDWTAKNIDWFDNPNKSFLPTYKTKTNAPMLFYDNYYCLYVGADPARQAKHIALVDYVNRHGLNLEDMFLHFDVPTTVTLKNDATGLNETYTLPAGSRVPTYGWYGTGGDLTKAGARVVMNAANADYRNFNAEYVLNVVNTDHGGTTYDGIWVDNSGGSGPAAPGTITSGGTYAEYPGKTRTDAHVQYSNDIVSTFAAVRDIFGPKGAAGSKMQVPNNGNYFNWLALFPYVDGVFREFEIRPDTVTSDSIEGFIKKMSEAQTAGVPNIASTTHTGITPTDTPREKMTALSMYYLAATPNDYLCKQDKNGSDPQTTAWFGALDYNVGQPKGSYSVLASGLDPSSPRKDSGTGTVSNVGSAYKITDPTKNWAVDYWQGIANFSYIKDSQGNFFKTYDSDTNWVSSYVTSAPYPVSGSYEVATFLYKLFTREFDNALIILKPRPSYAATETGDPSATTENLPVTADNPSGRYFKLNANGTVEAAPITQISLRNAEGAILIKESALTKPTLSLSADNNSGTLTYTVSYTNPSTITFTNAKIEDPIPSGTNYVTDSATGGATYDPIAKKIVLTIGNFLPGSNGTVTFKVNAP